MHNWFLQVIASGLTPNQLYLLVAISQKESPRLINTHAELRALRAGDWVDEGNSLSEKAQNLIAELSLAFPQQKKKAPAKPTADFTENVQKYVEIFPRKRLPSGSLARVHVSNLEAGFKWFLERYSYSWDIILRATQMYVTEYERRNYEYMKTSQYFIRKQKTDKSWESELANYCAMVDSEDTDLDTPTSFDEKVN